MAEFLGDLEGIFVELYTYRWLVGIGLLMAVAALAVVGYRRGWHMRIWKRRRAVAVVSAPVFVAAIIGGWYTLSPLLERTQLEEASPLDAIAMNSGSVSGIAANTAPPSGVTHRGQFMGADAFHFARGQALLIETSPGQHTLRFEDFSIRNGPGLYVYLSPEADDYTDDSLEIGKLKATDGAFNYEIPAGTDISQYKSVVVWCKPFGVLFAAAPLAEL